MYAAMNLVAAFFFMAGIYVLLTAHLIAFMQILVYAGAVMVLFLFVIMLLSLGDEHAAAERTKAMQYVGHPRRDRASACSPLRHRPRPGRRWARSRRTRFGTVKAVGQVLFTEFLLPFEVTSLLSSSPSSARWSSRRRGSDHGPGHLVPLPRRDPLHDRPLWRAGEAQRPHRHDERRAHAQRGEPHVPRVRAPDGDVGGHAIAFFVIAVAAAEAAVGLAVVIAIYRTRGSVNVDEVRALRE